MIQKRASQFYLPSVTLQDDPVHLTPERNANVSSCTTLTRTVSLLVGVEVGTSKYFDAHFSIKS